MNLANISWFRRLTNVCIFFFLYNWICCFFLLFNNVYIYIYISQIPLKYCQFRKTCYLLGLQNIIYSHETRLSTRYSYARKISYMIIVFVYKILVNKHYKNNIFKLPYICVRNIFGYQQYICDF